jgi:hypothetical protein
MKPVHKQFNFSFAELVQRGDKCEAAMERDATEFAAYGSTVEDRNKLASFTAELKAFPSDDYYEGLQKVETDQKRKSRSALETLLVDHRNRAELALGEKSVEYSLFRYKPMKEYSDSALVQQATHAVTVSANYMDVLSGRQVTPATLDNIIGGRDLLDSNIDRQSKAQTLRSQKSQERNTLANKLYKMISEACKIGKMVWGNKNEAFYTDYVIYGSSKSMEDQAADNDGDDGDE